MPRRSPLRLAADPDDALPTVRLSITVPRAARAIDADPSTIRKMLDDNLLEGHTVGRGTKRPRRRVYVDSLERWQFEHATGTQRPAAERPAPRPRPPSTAVDRESVAALRRYGVL